MGAKNLENQRDMENTVAHEEPRLPLSFLKKVKRLNDISANTGFHPINDIDWDDDAMAVDLRDPIWITSCESYLTQSSWFRGLPQDKQIDLAIDIIAQRFGVGIAFENILQQGLLKIANGIPPDSPIFRYIHHEIIEESRHSMMFKLLLQKLEREPGGIPKPWNYYVPFLIQISSFFPELFFFYILGGEEPIDHFQRSSIKNKDNIHPLLHRIMQIHVIEETRHLSFAHLYLEERLPKLSKWKRQRIAYHAPFLLRIMIDIMLVPSKEVRVKHGIPDGVMKECFSKNPEFRGELSKSISNTRRVLQDAGMIYGLPQRIWKRMGIA